MKKSFMTSSFTTKIAGSYLVIGMIALAALPILHSFLTSVFEENRTAKTKSNATAILDSIMEDKNLQNVFFFKALSAPHLSTLTSEDFEPSHWEDLLFEHEEEIRKQLGNGFLLLYNEDAELLSSNAIPFNKTNEVPSPEDLDPVQQAVFEALESDRSIESIFMWEGYGVYRIDIVPLFDEDEIISKLIVSVTDLSTILLSLEKATKLEVLLEADGTTVGDLSIDKRDPSQTSYEVLNEESGKAEYRELISLPFERAGVSAGTLFLLSNSNDWREASHAVQRLSIFIGLAFLALIGIGGYIMARSTSKPLQNYIVQTHKESKGLQEVADHLEGLTSSITSSSKSQISAFNETLSAMNELLKSNKIALDSAESGKGELSKTLLATHEGKKISNMMDKNFSNMRRDTDQLKDVAKFIVKIADTVKEIDSIVFESKILSFNASIEAEVAGEAGRGFAVVADQVSELAHSSSHIAKRVTVSIAESEQRIKDLINNTQETIIESEKKQTESSSNFYTLEDKMTDLSGDFEKIQSSMAQQAKCVIQLQNCLNDLDRKTKENIKSSESLTEQSEQLSKATFVIDDMVEKFSKLIEGRSA